MSLRSLKIWGVVWNAGGLWERLFVCWFFGGVILTVFLVAGTRLWLDLSVRDWQRLALIANAVVVTFLPTMWALETVATVRKALETGLEHPELARLKIEYLERYGQRGANPVARRWGTLYALLYVVWLLGGGWLLPILGFRDLFPIALLDGIFVFGLGILVTLRARAYYLLAESRGYPLAKLAVQLRKQGVRF
jgi:hypothetical protein